MRVILFGASGMVGQGVLRQCLLATDVTEVLAVVRSPLGRSDNKLRELRVEDFLNLEPLAEAMTGFDACFFCLGVTSVGRDEAEYTRLTYDTTLAVARVLARVSPQMVFIYVSGEGTDGSGKSRLMWARVKGRTENALLALPFRGVCMFRLGIMQPMHGERPRTKLYRPLYTVLGWLFPLLRSIAGSRVTTTEEVGRAMLRIVREGSKTRILGNPEIAVLGG